jgi:hypothetical protein
MKLSLIIFGLAAAALAGDQSVVVRKDDGYRGIWYYNQPTHDEYVYKYSGGFATYPQQQLPIAYYSSKANKTFFCYGGSAKDKNELWHMVSYYDHATGMVPRPTILLDKQTDDAHDNPVLMLDDEGYVWVFSNSHGTSRTSYVHKSKKPYSVDEFERVASTNFSYGQPWYISGKGFFFLHTLYRNNGRSLFWATSKDGRDWAEPQLLARIEMGHYQVSLRDGERVGTMFNYHPAPLGLNARTNIYYLETRDMGKTWTNVKGEHVTVPLTEIQNAALVHDYRAEKLLAYLKDLQYDAQGQPVLLYLTSKGYEPGPKSDPRTYYTAQWTGKDWQMRRITTTDHNYDFASFYIERDGTWRVIATSDPGPQPWGTGGEVVMWKSRDRGAHWESKKLTSNSRLNQNYPRRPVNAHPDFYALWADGNPLKLSESSLYFTDREGTAVWMLPTEMKHDFEKPERVH